MGCSCRCRTGRLRESFGRDGTPCRPQNGSLGDRALPGNGSLGDRALPGNGSLGDRALPKDGALRRRRPTLTKKMMKMELVDVDKIILEV